MVSILMAVYNGERYLEEQLKSLEKQTVKEWRLIARDDGSSDQSLRLLREFQERVSQEVIIIDNKIEPHGAKYNFFALLEQVTDGYIMCCDQDDIWKETKIEHTLNAMKDAETLWPDVPIMVHTDLEVVDAKGQTIASSFFQSSGLKKELTLPQLLVQNHVTGCTTMLNETMWRRMGHLSVETQKICIMHDYWFSLFAQTFGKIVFLEESTIKYRQHEHNSVGAKDSKNLGRLLKKLRQGKKDYQEGMQASYLQVHEFVKIYGKECSNEETKQLLNCYGELANKSFIKRKHFYIKNHAWKQGTIRRIMQLIWG